MKQLILTGNTYSIRESLKKDGFRWNPTRKAWTRSFEDNDELLLKLADAYEENGVHTQVKTLSDPNERKYMIKESWIFNLESMHDKVHCLSYDIRDKKIELPFTVAGKVINDESDLWELLDEASTLEYAAKTRKVTGKEYGRIKAIVSWRVEARYCACMAAGMEEAQAGQCFEDM